MSNLIIDPSSFNNGFTMSSLEFLNGVINPAREEAGEKPIRHRDFIKRIKDELGFSESFAKVYQPEIGRPSKFYDLNADQLLLVGMRESKTVRLKVLEYIRKVEAKVKQLEEQKTRTAIQSANRRGVTWGDYCKTNGLPAQKLMNILKKERKLFRVHPISGEWSVNPTFAPFFRVIKSTDHRFNQSGINIRFNAKGIEFFSSPEHVQKFRDKLTVWYGSDRDKQQMLQRQAKERSLVVKELSTHET
ncbi:hypothetical protein [Lonsdalea quercina]|uniref:hypothetical protein n=1 Tax=Lonsdalea quercina TaxID=71657 RepID=UPI0039766DAA